MFDVTKSENSQVTYKAGVLIIGSLLWQDYLKNKDDCIRKKWRDGHLLLKDRLKILLPIRYGRKSSSDIYTMVFSNTCEDKLGKAFLVPFQKPKRSSLEDFDIDLSELSRAEGMGGGMVAGNKKIWGVLGILLNKQKLSTHKSNVISSWYKNHFSSEKQYNYKDFELTSIDPPIEENGFMNIKWPVSVEPILQSEIDSFDFLFAAVTKPTDYPNSTDLAKNVVGDIDRNYFLNNTKNGIETFQDVEILKKTKNLQVK